MVFSPERPLLRAASGLRISATRSFLDLRRAEGHVLSLQNLDRAEWNDVMFPAAHRLAALLALVAVLASSHSFAAQTPKQDRQTHKDKDDEASAPANLASRIASILVELAANAQSISDLDLRLDCQLEAAALLWPHEPDRARQLCVELFDGIALTVYPTIDERTAARRRLARLLAHVARRDAALAERFAVRITPLFPPGSVREGDGQTTRADLLIGAALEMLPGDPARAAALGQLALADGVTPTFVRFLVVLHAADSKRADLLFSSALALFLRTPDPRLSDVNVLSVYLVSTWGADLTHVSPDAMRAFLVTAIQLVNRTPLDSDEASNAYFVGRQLAPFVAKYLPEQAQPLELRVAILAQSDGFSRAQRIAPTRASDVASPDTQRAQTAATAVERDDFAAAHEEAAEIRDDTLRGRVYAQAVLRLLKLGRLDDAYREIKRLPDPARRASLLVQLAAVAHGRGDVARAVESLNEAEREATRVTRLNTRVQTLFSISSAFVRVDQLRAFETMQTAVEHANHAVVGDEKGGDRTPLPPKALNFNATFAQLARIDFDGAWLLARQFDGWAPRLLAELAVCRGGLAAVDNADVDEEPESEPGL